MKYLKLFEAIKINDYRKYKNEKYFNFLYKNIILIQL